MLHKMQIGRIMKKSAAFLANKKTDYFELFEKKKSKVRITLKTKQKEEVAFGEKTTHNRFISAEDRDRRIEIKAIKAEIYRLLTAREPQTTRIQMQKKSVEDRRAELIYCKQILEANVNTKSFIHFS